ncbi:MAG: hypothetical protein AB6733_09445 [Clostridiaceae bacterium]
MKKLGNIDDIFRSEYDFAYYKNESDSKLITKDKYSNNKILESIIDQFKECEKERVREYLSLVREKVLNFGKELIFVFSFSTIKAETVNLSKRIEIRISTEVNLNQLPEIFLHELGEAEYISSKFPVIMDTMEREDIKWRIIELFTHKFIHNRLQGLGFNNYITFSSESWLKRNYLSCDEVWKSVLMITWALISYPDLLNLKRSLIGYEKYYTQIDEIICELSDKELFATPNSISEACKTVKYIFEELGADAFEITCFI